MKNYFGFQLNGRKFFPIYLPEYFSKRTGSNTIDNQSIKFGYDLEEWKDLTLERGQTLLILIALGFYYPWAYAKVGQRVLGKTYMERFEG